MWLNVSKQTFNSIIIVPDKNDWANINNLIKNKAEYERNTLLIKPFLPHSKHLGRLMKGTYSYVHNGAVHKVFIFNF